MIPLVPGFADPVFDSQKHFRTLLTAMSIPAQPVPLSNLPPAPDGDSPFSAGMAALALTLCDSQAPVWLQPETDTEAVRHYLRFHCGAVFAEAPEQAAFAFISTPETMPPVFAFAQGTALYPEQSTTLVVEVSFSSGQLLQAHGPGIGGRKGSVRTFTCAGMPERFWLEWADNRRAFPLGVDVLLLDESVKGSGALLMGLSRMTAVCPVAQNGQENLTCMSP
jgi:alpha-D-ribose 1-methylphosphonate 5-triphosphate synthase subunit PhnH